VHYILLVIHIHFIFLYADFTPSRGSTPKHHFSAPGTPRMNKSLNLPTFPDTKLEPSPTDGKKRLFDLLQETFHEHWAGDQNAETNEKTDGYKLTNNQPPRSEGSPYLSGTNSVWSSEATPGRDPSNRKERTGRPKHCCFPGFVPSRSFSDRRKPKMSPARQTESG